MAKPGIRHIRCCPREFYRNPDMTHAPNAGRAPPSPTTTTTTNVTGRHECGRIQRQRTAEERAWGAGDVGDVDTGRGDPDQDLAAGGYRDRRVGCIVRASGEP